LCSFPDGTSSHTNSYSDSYSYSYTDANTNPESNSVTEANAHTRDIDIYQLGIWLFSGVS
jgi:hypothetical protein